MCAHVSVCVQMDALHDKVCSVYGLHMVYVTLTGMQKVMPILPRLYLTFTRSGNDLEYLVIKSDSESSSRVLELTERMLGDLDMLPVCVCVCVCVLHANGKNKLIE